MGYKIYVQPASKVYHIGGGTLPVGDSKKVYLNFRNNLIMLAKNLPVGQVMWKIPFRIILNEIFAVKALVNGHGKTFIVIIKAHLHFLRWLLFKKNKGKPIRKQIKLYGVYNGLVVWQYFMNRKRTFTEIVTPNDNI